MEKARDRSFYIDNLRVLMIAFVVMHHLAVAYSGFGSFPYYDVRHLSKLTTIWFGFYLSFQQAYFMGLLFMIAGYFAAASYDRKDLGQLLRGRFKRLVIPTLIYMVFITQFVEYIELGRNWLQPKPGLMPVFLRFLSGTGVMWFAVALFIFSVIYGLVRAWRAAPVSNRKQIKPSLINTVILILIISVCAFLIRIVQPIGTNILNMQLCYFASYIVLFIVGIMAYRNDLFARISYQTGKTWLICGIVLGLLAWLVLMKSVGALSGGLATIKGGLTWGSAGFSVWESFVAVAMSIGLIPVFREKFNYQTKLVKTLSDSSFTVYMFHPPILVAVILLFRPVTSLPIIVKWGMLCLICVPLCFATAHFVIRRIPLLNRVL